MDTPILKRHEQDPANMWSVEDIFPSDQAWEQELDACKDFPEELASYRGRLGESAQTLLQWLQRSEEIDQQFRRLAVYAMLRLDEDTADSPHQAMRGRCFSFMIRANTASSFEGPELVAIDDATLDSWYTQEPGLEKYRRYLTKARLSKAHILSPAEETLLAGAAEVGSAPSDIFNTFSNADLAFPDAADSQGELHPVTNGNYLARMSSKDRTLRENTFHGFYSTFKQYENTLASAYNAEIKKNIFFSRARKYPTALAASLFPNEVPESVYHNLVHAVRSNLDKMHRYMKLRKKIMNVDELHMYDIYANMLPESGRFIPFSEAKEAVLAATAVLGEDYSKVIRRSFEERWMDIYENKGKRSGAYSCGCYGVHPFVLLNHNNNLKSQFTLAHELGHALHSYLSEHAQPSIYAGYVLFVAEVASICNEALLMQHLLRNTTDKAQRAVLINYRLEQFRTTLYRQTMFAEFELRAHELAEQGETLTAKTLNDLYYQLNVDYYGDDIIVDRDIEIEWSRIPHFYRRFYVYQYATGFAAAMALSKRILTEGEPAVQDYLKFLSGGSSTDPISLLKIAGVDMSTPDPINTALEQFGEMISELEALVEG